VDRRPESVIDLLDEHFSDSRGFVRAEPAFVELLGESS
jgi:hypothetical protein